MSVLGIKYVYYIKLSMYIQWTELAYSVDMYEQCEVSSMVLETIGIGRMADDTQDWPLHFESMQAVIVFNITPFPTVVGRPIYYVAENLTIDIPLLVSSFLLPFPSMSPWCVVVVDDDCCRITLPGPVSDDIRKPQYSQNTPNTSECALLK